MAVSASLLKQLLALGESERVELAHALLSSVEDADDDDGMTAADREQLHASIERSFDQIDAGLTMPFDDVIASLRAKRAGRAAH
jgi:hypothetical protein